MRCMTALARGTDLHGKVSLNSVGETENGEDVASVYLVE